MMKLIKNSFRPFQTKFSFGATSAIITILALITGLDTLTYPKLSIIGGILIIAIADNVSDSLGIHIYQESECIEQGEVWLSTFTNFFTRLLVSLSFMLFIVLLPIDIAVPLSVAWGLLLLGLMSYAIARREGIKPHRAILEHLAIAVVIIAISNFAGKFIIGKLR